MKFKHKKTINGYQHEKMYFTTVSLYPLGFSKRAYTKIELSGSDTIVIFSVRLNWIGVAVDTRWKRNAEMTGDFSIPRTTPTQQ